jgi:squalene cyclase
MVCHSVVLLTYKKIIASFYELELHNTKMYFVRLGTWGVCFTYGAFFSVKALVCTGRTYENSCSIRKACHFILSKQLITGGWGESHVSNEAKVNIDLFLSCFFHF